MKKSPLRKKSRNLLKGLKDRADRALQDFYRATYPDKKCESCGAPFQLMHHFIPKSQSNYLRYMDSNLIFLCHKCHYLHHNTGDPLIHGRVIQGRGFEWLDAIQQARRVQRSSPGKKEYLEVMKKYAII